MLPPALAAMKFEGYRVGFARSKYQAMLRALCARSCLELQGTCSIKISSPDMNNQDFDTESEASSPGRSATLDNDCLVGKRYLLFVRYQRPLYRIGFVVHRRESKSVIVAASDATLSGNPGSYDSFSLAISESALTKGSESRSSLPTIDRRACRDGEHQ